MPAAVAGGGSGAGAGAGAGAAARARAGAATATKRAAVTCSSLQKMSGRESKGVKRPRRQQGKDKDAEPAPLHWTAHPTPPLPLLPVVQSFRGMCASMQLCDAQGAALFPFVRLPPHVRRPFAGAPVRNMSVAHAERLRVVGCALTGKLVRLLSLGVGRTSTTSTSTVSTTAPTPITGTSTTTTITTTICYTITTHYPPHFEPPSQRHACHKLMQGIVRRVAARLAAAVGSKVGKEAEELCASGQCAAAAVALKLAVNLGHLPSRALLAHMMLDGREGVARERAFELVEEGVRSGCHHCQGVMATLCCKWRNGPCGGLEGDVARALELARESSGKGSKYGQYALGRLLEYGAGLAEEEEDSDDWAAQVIALYRLAAAQGHAGAQNELGNHYTLGNIIAEDDAEGLRWHRLAAAQGHPDSLCYIGGHFQWTIQDVEEAIRWYRRAQAAGHINAAYLLQQLGVFVF